MTQLYYCNARISDGLTLYSYSTPVVGFDFNTNHSIITCTVRRASMTTMQHIRKYANWLQENGYKFFSECLTATYRESVSLKLTHYSRTFSYPS